MVRQRGPSSASSRPGCWAPRKARHKLLCLPGPEWEDEDLAGERQLGDVVSGGHWGFDEVDGLPKVVAVGWRDFAGDALGLATFLADLASDLFVLHHYWALGETWAWGVLLSVVLATLVLLNVLSVAWWWSDLRRPHDDGLSRPGLDAPTHSACPRMSRRGFAARVCAAAALLGPAVFYLDSATAAYQFRKAREAAKAVKEGHPLGKEAQELERMVGGGVAGGRDPRTPGGSRIGAIERELYLRMLDADRDATLLRLFEAFLESAPQALIQGYFFVGAVLSGSVTTRLVVVQAVSSASSLSSLAWAIVAQHRCLRKARQDKENLSFGAMGAIFVWRFLTIAGKLGALTLFAAAFQYWLIVGWMLHYGLGVASVLLLTPLHLNATWLQEVLVVASAAWVGVVAPFNLVEGRTLWRYAFWYAVEAAEVGAVAALCLLWPQWPLPDHTDLVFAGLGLSWSLGILTMVLYYLICHPVRAQPTNPDEQFVELRVPVMESN